MLTLFLVSVIHDIGAMLSVFFLFSHRLAGLTGCHSEGT